MRQSQNQRLIALFDSLPLEQEVSNTEIQVQLHIGPYSRRIEDVRYGHYLQLGYLILNCMERVEGIVHSYYRKVRAADYPAEHSEALAAYERKSAGKVRIPEKSSRQEHVEWYEKEFHYKPKTAEPKPEPEPEPEWSLTP